MGSVGFLVNFEFHMAVLGIPSGPIGFIAPLSFKWLDSQSDSSNMGPVSIDVQEFQTFSKSGHGFLTCYLSCFGTCRRKITFPSFPVGTKKNRDKKLRRFVVVSPREVPSLTFSCPFKILMLGSFLQPPPFSLPQPSRKSVH